MDLVGQHARAPQVASWDHPLAHPNIEDARIVHKLAPLARVPGLSRFESAYRQRFRLKSWQYMTATSDDMFIAFVVGTAGFASNGFVYAVELPSGAVHKRFAITPLSVGTRLAPSSAAGEHRFATRGLSVAVDNRDAGRGFGARIEAQLEGGGRLAAALTYASAPRDEHLSLCVPLPGGRWNYTHKFAAFTVAGEVHVDGRRFVFGPSTHGHGTLDFTKMYALRHAVWRWVSVCARSTRGAVIGLNLVDPTPDAPVSENAVWIDGVREPLAGVHLDVAGDDARSPWRVTANAVDVGMQPIAHVEQQLDIPLLRHKLRHVVGRFSGHVRTSGGQIHDLVDAVGIAEDWDTWW
ncbi:MAG: DUF2804 domain-containing protein [Deltaproteobacteria bacterium]|nr:DUF2804 domain-containing protein [Deltaproteobacteria bacterium]